MTFAYIIRKIISRQRLLFGVLWLVSLGAVAVLAQRFPLNSHSLEKLAGEDQNSLSSEHQPDIQALRRLAEAGEWTDLSVFRPNFKLSSGFDRTREDLLRYWLPIGHDAEQFSYYLEIYCENLSAEGFADAFQFLLKQGNSRTARLLRLCLLEQWAKVDPASALEANRLIHDPYSQMDRLRAIVNSWMRTDPVEAALWMVHGGEERTHLYMHFRALSDLSDEDAQRVFDIFLPDPRFNKDLGPLADRLFLLAIENSGESGGLHFLNTLPLWLQVQLVTVLPGFHYAVFSHDSIVEFIQSQDNPAARTQLAAAYLNEWMEYSPEQVMATIETFPPVHRDLMYSEAMRVWLMMNWEAALDSFHQLEPETLRYRMAEKLTPAFFQYLPIDMVVEWANEELPPDSGLEMLARRISREFPEEIQAALEWASLMENQNLSNEVRRSLITEWMFAQSGVIPSEVDFWHHLTVEEQEMIQRVFYHPYE